MTGGRSMYDHLPPHDPDRLKVDEHYTTGLDYSGRRYGDETIGQPVTLLAAGRATCPTCLAIGSQPCTWETHRRPGTRHKNRPPIPEHVQ